MNSVNEMSKKSAHSEQNVHFNNRAGSLGPLNDQAGSSAMILNNQAGSPSAVPLNDGASSSVALKDQAGPSSVPMNNHEGPLPTVEGNSTGQRDRKSPVLKKGTWTPAEDAILVEYVRRNGEGNWNSVHKKSGLVRCGKSCRLRWTNHLSPNLKKGIFSAREEKLLVELHAMVGNKWSRMSTFFPGRTDNELKNYWNTRARRCMRANLPIYPPKVLEALKENWQPDNDLACPLSIYNIDIPIDPTPVDNQDIVFSEPAVPNNPFSSMPNQVPNLSQNPNLMPTTMHQLDMVVPPQESGSYIPPFRYGGNINHHSSLTTPYTPLQQSENPAHYSANPEAPNVFVKNFPASPPGLLRGELPSLQYPDPGYWSSSSSQLPPLQPGTTFAPPPPPSRLLQSDSSLQMNSVLLDAILHQSHNLSTRNMAFIKNPNSCVVAPGDKGKSSMPSFNNMQWNRYDGFVPSFGHPAMPFNQHVAASIGSWNDQVAPTTFVPAAPVLSEGVPAGVGSWNGQIASVNNSDSEPASVGFWNGQVAPSTFVPGYHVPQGGNEYVAPNGWQAEVPTQQNVWNADSFMNMGWDEIAAQINDPSFLSDDLPRLLREDSFNGHHQQRVAGCSTPNQGWVGTSTSNQGFVGASTSNQGWQEDASTSNQGAVNNQEWGSSSYMWNNNGVSKS